MIWDLRLDIFPDTVLYDRPITNGGVLDPILKLGLISIVSLMGVVAGMILLPEPASARSNPACPSSWPAQGYEGPLRVEDHGRISYEDFTPIPTATGGS